MVLLVLLAVGLAFFGITAPIFYGLLAGLVMPVVVSMRLHQLAEKSLVVIPKQLTHWTVYVQGIPVQETRNSLTNPCFAIGDQLQTFFWRAFFLKFVIQAGALLMLLLQLWPFSDIWVVLGGGLLVGIWLWVKCVDTGKTLASVKNQTWVVEEVRSAMDSLWYRADFSRQGQRIAALEKLLAL
ncbi:hypothetical protein ACQ86O_19480 [Serratia sp. L9]|uniref:hypothetical protein n=1 Tax=Serratia sp. L9 TaxID=3423946 RepID=UPI003D66C33A